MRRSKYGNRKTEVDGYVFDSGAEARRYQELKLAERSMTIGNLELQRKYPVVVNGHHICDYLADFAYMDLERGVFVVEDVKGMKTDVYRLKKKLVEALYDFKITEIKA